MSLQITCHNSVQIREGLPTVYKIILPQVTARPGILFLVWIELR